MNAGPITIGPHMPAPILDRVTSWEDPTMSGSAYQGALAYAYHFLGGDDRYGSDEGPMSPEKALTYSAVWGCVQVIAQSLAGVGWHVFERAADDPRKKMPITENLQWTLDLQANPEMTAFAWREAMLTHALLWGNGYSEIERTGMGKLQWLWPIHPDRVKLIRDQGKLWYEVQNQPGGSYTYLAPENMYHLHGPSLDGLQGLSVVSLAKRSIRLGLREEKFGEDFFGRGPMPGGFLTIPKAMNATQRGEARQSFERVYSGQRNSHRVVVLSDGMEFAAADMPNDDAQFLESRTFQVTEICRWFRVPPHKLADLTRATFSNIEEQERAFVGDCLLPWACRLEGEANVKCLSFAKQGRRFTRLNLDALQRGNSQTQTSTVSTKVNSALMTVNEGREYFDLNPLEGGDTPLIQGAMVPLDTVINPPEPPPEPAPAPPPPAEEQEEEAPPPPPKEEQAAQARARKEDIRRVFGKLLTSVYARLLRLDADRARRASNKGKVPEYIREWLTGEKAVARLQDEMRPPAESLALAMGKPTALAEAWAAEWAVSYAGSCRDDIKVGTSCLAQWESTRAVVLADSALAPILAEFNEEDAEVGHDREDAEAEAAWDREDTAISAERDRQDEEMEAARQMEDDEREAARDAEDAKVDEREDKGEITDAQANGLRDASSQARKREDMTIRRRRDSEDRERESQRHREDRATADRRTKEDRSREAQRRGGRQ